MGVGFIQLLTVGGENKIFNYNPNISFFKIYYRRHTNFFMNNMIINGNSINIDDDFNIISKLINFKIPLDGDLLTKSYLHLEFDDYYFEFFAYNSELYSTFSKSILSLYNNYYIKTNNYCINDIKDILTIKVIYNNKSTIKIMSNVIDNNKIIYLINNEKFIQLEKSSSEIYYNMDLTDYFYSFVVNLDTNIKDNELFSYLYNNINYLKLDYIQIDFYDIRTSLRIFYHDKILFKLITDILYNDEYIKYLLEIRIDKNYVYFACSFVTKLFKKILELMYIGVTILNLEILNNKYATNKIKIDKNIYEKIIGLIDNKNANTFIYLQIYNYGSISESQITIMENITFFGNITNEYYNNLLLNDSNDIMFTINVNNNRVSCNVLTRLLISLVCFENNVSIQEYINIVNGKKINLIENFVYYNNNLDIFSEKLITNFMDPDILIVSKKSFYILSYSRNIFKYFYSNTYCEPFIDKKFSVYTETIINNYLFSSIISSLNNYFNNNTDDFYLKIMQLIFFVNLLSAGPNEANNIIYKQVRLNYTVNNFLFNLFSIQKYYLDDDELLVNKQSFTYYVNNPAIYYLFKNTLTLFIVESLTLINYITNKLSSYVYETDGNLTGLFYNTKSSTSVFPLSSNIFVFTNNTKQNCETTISNNNMYFNKQLLVFINDLYKNIISYMNLYFEKFKINIDTEVEFNMRIYLDGSSINTIIKNYYQKSLSNVVELDLNNLNIFLESIKALEYQYIYSFTNINDLIMYQLFNYVDNNLYNNTFSSFIYNKYSTCNSSIYNTNLRNESNYLKFIFSIGSPLYRLYFLFTFLSKFSIDTLSYNYLINDNDFTNSQSDIINLRNLILSFIITYLYYFNDFDLNIISYSNEYSKFNLDILNNPDYILSNNFICFDQINIFNDKDFVNQIREENSSTFMLIYNSFYFLQKKNNKFELNFENLNDIPNICNNIKYNFDDNIIILFLNVLEINREFFMNFNGIYNFVLTFFDKYNNDYYKMIKSFISLETTSSTSNEIILKILKDDFYQRCYNSTYMLGTLFDNTYNLNVKAINNIFSFTTELNYSGYDYEFSFKNPNIIKNQNFLSTNNITKCLQLFLTLLYPIFDTRYRIIDQYYYNYVNSIINYTNNNTVYFYIYLVSEINFRDSISIINKNINKFNLVNNSNINLLSNNNTTKYNDSNFVKYNFVIILYYYIYFIRECLFADIKTFESKNTLDITFEEYISTKYTKNIYYDTINNILNLFKFSSQEINIDFSILYYSSLLDNEISDKQYSDVITISNSYSKLEFNYIKSSNELITNTNRLIYVSLNNSDNIYFNSIANQTQNIILITTYFNDFYFNLIYNITDKMSNILYSVLDGNLYEKSDTIGDYTDKSLIKNYNIANDYYYNSSINTLKFLIYKELYNSYQSNLGYFGQDDKNADKNADKNCNLILKILRNFYSDDDYNYFYSIYYHDRNIKNNQRDKINISNEFSYDYNEFFDNINNFYEIKSLNYLYSKYINILITNSIKFEKEINRIIYFLCTSYLINNSYDKINIKNKLYSKTLYDIVKLYINENDVNLEKIQKIYLKNTSLYSDQPVFQLFNYENLIDNMSLTQNYWINEIIEMINTDINDVNSYYTKFIDFTNYLKLNSINCKLFLDEGISVFEYFKNINNYDELCNLIFDYICLNDYFSPMYIFNNIVFLNQSDFINSKLDIKTDHLKKKIAVFLFFNYIILSYLPELLVKYIEINENIVLEYTIDNDIYDIKLKDVLSIEENIEIIKWSIREIYNFTNLHNDIVLNIPSNLSILEQYKDIIHIVKFSKINFSSIPYYNVLCERFISAYNNTIGYDYIDNDKLINIDFKPTYTNLISNINVIFNNDTKNNNTNINSLTFYSLKILNIKLSNLIYDLNNTQNNKIYNTSNFTNLSKSVYTKAQINDFNMVYNLLCLLLKNYNITYSNLTNDINSVINNLRIGSNPMNDTLENYKGYVSELKLSINLTPIEDLDKSQYYMNRLYVIQSLTKLVSNLNNLSLITPNDYDDIIFVNFKYSYKNFFQKYYSYNYNYYNFINNEKIIFDKLYDYYKKIVYNKNAITNIKNNNLHLYIWMFIDLINSYIANNYYNGYNEPSQYLEQLNNLTGLYLKYNYKFRINPNIPNSQNLKIQFEYNNFKNADSYAKLLPYLINYYYYQLFSSQISQFLDFKSNTLEFFNILNNTQNIYFNYTKNYFNLILKLEIIIRFILYKISKIYKIPKNTQHNINYEKYIEEIKNKLMNYFSNLINIQTFFNIKIANLSNIFNYNNSELFKLINNSTNKDVFFKRFSMSITKLLFWINEYSYETNSINTWNEYFKNFIIEYYEYSDNQYKKFQYNLTYSDFTLLTYNYINYTIFKNNGITNYIDIELTSVYNSIFSYTGYKGKTYILDPYVVNKILYNTNIDNDESNNLKKEENNTIKSVFYNIILIIINTKWGTIVSNASNMKPNYIIKSSILYFNYYFTYLNYLLNNKNKITIKEFDFDYYNEIFYELYILYYLILIIITCSYINFNSYYDLLGKMIINAHTYVEFGNIINSLDLPSNFSIYMDNLNSNIIKDNYVANFYKKIQNASIYDNLKYGINNFKENLKNFDSYITNIYNQQYNTLLFNTENTIGYNTFFNIIINTLNNFTTNADIYIDEIKITTSVYNTIYSSLNKCVGRLKSYLGGDNYTNITLNQNNINKIYELSNFKEENSQINMFTMIYKKFGEGKILNNIIIIMFYNICFLSWSTLGINILDNSDIFLNLFYVLANVINGKIMDYVKYLNNKNTFKNIQITQSKEHENLEEFFNNMNVLLFKNYNNNEFIDQLNIFFQKIICDHIYNSTNINSPFIYQLNINLNSKENIFKNKSNYKIINWTYLIGLCVDYNNTIFTKNFKSILNIYSDENILDYVMNYIFEINQGIINEYGIIKIINNLELLFDDESISKYTGYDYKIFIDNFQNLNKQKLLNEMLGISDPTKNDNIISGVKPYIKIFKKKNYIIPIKFFFEKYFNAIPQIACMYTKINLKLELFNTNLLKNTYLTKNLKIPKISTYLDLNFIILERDERKSICKNKIDNLIERKNNYSLVKNILNFKDNVSLILNQDQNNKYLKINFDFDLNNIVKEIMWTFNLYIDNYKITLLKNINIINPFESINTTLDGLKFENFDFIVNTKFLIDGARRDGINSLDNQNFKTYNAITTILNPYKYNTKTLLSKNYNTYSFGLEPTEFQPSGTFNMSNIAIFTIQIEINTLKLINYIKNLNVLFDLYNLNFNIELSTFEYNLVRYQSGLSGLLFIK